jgi:hypothetical protein
LPERGKPSEIAAAFQIGSNDVGCRIDDPNGGWKGRGLWTTFGNRTPFHVEVARAIPPRWFTFSCAPIHWRIGRHSIAV